jgi:hypothetical protein
VREPRWTIGVTTRDSMLSDGPVDLVAVFKDGIAVKVYGRLWGSILARILARIYIWRHR